MSFFTNSTLRNASFSWFRSSSNVASSTCMWIYPVYTIFSPFTGSGLPQMSPSAQHVVLQCITVCVYVCGVWCGCVPM